MGKLTLRIGTYEFDSVIYDAEGDVLYLRIGESRPAADTHATPEGHAVNFDDHGALFGITIVNAKWLLERDGKVTITFPSSIETSAEELGPALATS